MEPRLNPRKKKIITGLLILLLGVATTWLILTPSGINGKLFAAGYAVCHQIVSHSFQFGDKVLPLCARCTGMYLGALAGLMILFPKDRRSNAPSRAKFVVLGIFLLAFILDGVNSSLTLIPGVTPLYPPSNLLRLITGLLMGIVLSNLILPLWNQTLWVEQNKQPVLRTWKQLVFVLIVEILTGIVVLLDLSFTYYPIVILSIGTIFLMIGMIYTLLWMILLKKENTLTRLRDGIPYFIVGLITAFVQIGLMDLVRFSITGTWHGLQF
jgi:uncharacterized membrane protein